VDDGTGAGRDRAQDRRPGRQPAALLPLLEEDDVDGDELLDDELEEDDSFDEPEEDDSFEELDELDESPPLDDEPFAAARLSVR